MRRIGEHELPGAVGQLLAALRALLDLPHPDHPDSPRAIFPAPESLRVPRAEQRPMAIKLADPDPAGRRAARLAAQLGNAELGARAMYAPRCRWPTCGSFRYQPDHAL